MSRLDAGAHGPLPRDEPAPLPPVQAPEGAAVESGRPRLVPPSRYRHPGDVLWLIAAGLLLLLVLTVSVIAADALWGADAAVVAGVEPDTAVGRILVGLVQGIAVLAPVVVAGALLWFRRFRLLATLVGTAVAAAAGWAGLVLLLSPDGPARVAASQGSAGWLFGAGFPGPAAVAAAVGVTLAASPWLSLPWRRVAWPVVGLSAVADLVAGVALPVEMVLAVAVGAVVGAGVLVALGAPDRRIDEDAVREALRAAGLAVRSVRRADVHTKGSEPFVATLSDGSGRFVKALGPDQRHADLLYRGYRFARLRGVGDALPASSLKQSVEHQALVGLVADRAAVRVPRVDRLAAASGGSLLLVMQLVDGRSLQAEPGERVTDELLRGMWDQVRRMHGAGIAHRSLRPANVMVDGSSRPWIVDFSFAELVATERQRALDRAELLASTACLVGADRAVAAAAAVLDGSDLASAVPLLQPLALSSATRRAIHREPGLLGRTRAATAAAASAPSTELPSLQRVRLRTLLVIAAAAGAFYFVLPQLAQVGDSWRVILSANWAWVPLLIALSAASYLASAASVLGSVPQRLPLLPTLLSQFASSFANRVSPANVGGMALNVRFLQKGGMDAGSSVAAVGLNSLAGGIVHLGLLVVFLAWSGSDLASAFHLPSASKLLLGLAVLAAIVGVLMVTRWGRRKVLTPVVGAVRSGARSLRRVARSPGKLALLVGGSAGVTLAYIGAFAVAVHTFGGTAELAEIAVVYLAGSVIGAAAPTPGGLGPLEAALIAGLTGIGVVGGVAVSAVLTYRLATYWLPVLPGWLSLHLLQRRNYV
jgi:undecaprenyl-diphosphatase